MLRIRDFRLLHGSGLRCLSRREPAFRVQGRHVVNPMSFPLLSSVEPNLGVVNRLHHSEFFCRRCKVSSVLSRRRHLSGVSECQFGLLRKLHGCLIHWALQLRSALVLAQSSRGHLRHMTVDSLARDASDRRSGTHAVFFLLYTVQLEGGCECCWFHFLFYVFLKSF